MIFYIGATALSVLFAKLAVKAKDELNRKTSSYYIFAFLSMLVLLIVAALRNEVGTDWNIYLTFFESINNGGDKFAEPGFNLLNRLAYFLTGNFRMLLIIVSIIIYSFVFKAIFDQSVIIPLSVLMFVLTSDYFNSFNQLRQAIAMAIFLYSLKYLWKRKFIPYLLWILVAATMHLSALIYIPIYFLYGKKVNFRVHLIILIANAALLPLTSKVIRWVVEYTRYSWYFGSYYDTNDFYILGFVFSLIVLGMYYYYYYKKKDLVDHQYNFMVNIYFISMLLLLYSAALPQVIRLSNIFAAANLLCIPRMVMRETERNKRIMLYVFIFVMFAAKLLFDIYVYDWYITAPELPSL